MAYLRPQPKGAFHHWYNTPGIIHQQFEGGLGRCTFDPPVCFDTKGYVDPPLEKQAFLVQECGDIDVPMKVVQLVGWPVSVIEDFNACTTLPGNSDLPPEQLKSQL